MAQKPEYADPQRYIELVGFRGTWRDLFWNHDFLDLMARRLELFAVRDALDVGCGAGHWGRALWTHTPPETRWVGVDPEEAFLSLARESANGRAEYRVATAESLPFPDASFDLVTCQLVLIHVKDAAAALREMIRVLRPGGVLLAAEPDNRAGNIALLNGEPRPCDEDYLAILELLLVGERGKQALGEGDQSIGGRLPGLFASSGLSEVMAYTNDRCINLHPPYARNDEKVWLDQELAWSAEDASVLCGSRETNWRFFEAGGGNEKRFDECWAAVRRWMTAVREGIETHTYASARGFVMYLVSGRTRSD